MITAIAGLLLGILGYCLGSYGKWVSSDMSRDDLAPIIELIQKERERLNRSGVPPQDRYAWVTPQLVMDLIACGYGPTFMGFKLQIREDMGVPFLVQDDYE